jgi:hypothetical protein
MPASKVFKQTAARGETGPHIDHSTETETIQSEHHNTTVVK